MGLGKLVSMVAKASTAAAPEAKAVGRALKGPPAGRSHLVAKKVDVTRNGQMFQSTRYVKPDGTKSKGAAKAVAPAAAGHEAPKSLKQNMIEVIKGGVALKVAKKSAGIAIGAVAAGNELSRRRGDKDAPAAFSDTVTQFDGIRSKAVGVGIGMAGAGLAGDILHRIPAAALSAIPVVGKPLAMLAKVATHKATHRAMIGGAAVSIANFDAAGRTVARKWDEGKNTGPFAGLKEHAFLLHSGLPSAVTAPATMPGTSISNPLRKVKGYEPQVGGHGTKKSDH